MMRLSVSRSLYSGRLDLRSSALATADLRVLATIRAPLRGTTARTAWACGAGSPWIWRTTSRIFCADIRTFLVIAWTSISLLRFGFGSVRAMLLKCARGRKLAQPVPDHVFGHEYRSKNLP